MAWNSEKGDICPTLKSSVPEALLRKIRYPIDVNPWRFGSGKGSGKGKGNTLGWSHCEMVADTFVGYGPPWRRCLAAGQPAESLVITFDRSFEVLGRISSVRAPQRWFAPG